MLVALGVLAIACALTVDGLVYATAPPRPDATTATATVADAGAGGPLVDGTRRPAVTYQVPAKTVVLTFDGGPDPTWTPRVLAVLRKHGVPGTFFVTGKLAARYPDVVGQIQASGSELGLRRDSVRGTGWRTRLELGVAQLAVAGGAGVTTSLVRMPYSPAAVRSVGRSGYATVLATLDSGDWRRAGVDAVVRNATPQDGKGAVVRFRDGGGDRSQSVAALDRLIPELRRAGYVFDTVGEVVGTTVNPAASTWQHTRGMLMTGTVQVAHVTTRVLGGLLLAVGVLLVVRLVLVLVVARRHPRRSARRRDERAPPPAELVSVIVPAADASRLSGTIRSVTTGDYPVEVIVVDDGTSPGTVEAVECLALPQVRVIPSAATGRAAALNAGIAGARSELVVLTEAGAVFGPHTVSRLVHGFADPAVGAVAGNVRVDDRGGFAATYWWIECSTGAGLDRRVYDVLGRLPVVPSTVGAFRRQALLQVGGFSDDTVAADADLTMAVCRAGWVVEYDETATVRLEAPDGFAELLGHASRRAYGTMQAVWKHCRAMVERGASGRLGRRGLLGMTLGDVLLPLLSPLVEVFLVYGVVFLDPSRTVLAYLGLLLVQACPAWVALRLDRAPVRLAALVPLHQLVRRHLGFLVTVRALAAAAAGTADDPVERLPALAVQQAETR